MNKLTLVASLATIIGTIVAIDTWRSGGDPKYSASNNTGGLNIAGPNSGSVNYNTTVSPSVAADIFNPSMIYVDTEASRQFGCTMNDGRCDQAQQNTLSRTLTLQFGNDGSGAAKDVVVEVYVQGGGQPLEKHLGRISKGQMTKSVFAVRSPNAPRASACIEYSEESGARKWVVLAGQSSDGSGGVMTGLMNFADFQKVDDGTLTSTDTSPNNSSRSGPDGGLAFPHGSPSVPLGSVLAGSAAGRRWG